MAKLDEQQNAKETVRSKQSKPNEPQSDLRGREVIYVDTDDDVTSIVTKIKQTEQAVVALVPPKRIGVLQSVVNLKLLQRAARTQKKRLAIVSTDQAMINLAAGLSIPVAKNINAQAIIPEGESFANDDVIDIIDGNEMSVSSRNDPRGKSKDKDMSAAVAAIETDDRIKNDLDADGIPDDQQDENSKKPKARIKVPSINSLRKKIIIGATAGVVLIGFLVWAIVFAPQAVITIKAKTSPVEVSKKLSLIPSSDRNVNEGILPPVIKQKKTTETVNFDATGSREVGDNAIGTISFCYNEQPFNGQTGEKNVINLAAGTLLYAKGIQFSIDADIAITGGRNIKGKCETYYSVKATATTIGEEGNIKKNTDLTVSGYGDLIALAKDDFTGGSKRTVKVIQQSDIDAAVAKLKEKGNGDAAKEELISQMAASTKIIDNSFSVNESQIKISPAIGEPVENQASASMEITYTLVGVNNDDLKSILDTQLKSQLDTNKQKIYDNGLKNIKFTGFTAADGGYTVIAKTSGQIGPVINADSVKKEAVGKKSEEIKALIKQIEGVSDVDVKMGPFWVSSAPSANKIKINFTIDE